MRKQAMEVRLFFLKMSIFMHQVYNCKDDEYYIAFDYVVDNQDIRNKYRMLESIAEKSIVEFVKK